MPTINKNHSLCYLEKGLASRPTALIPDNLINYSEKCIQWDFPPQLVTKNLIISSIGK